MLLRTECTALVQGGAHRRRRWPCSSHDSGIFWHFDPSHFTGFASFLVVEDALGFSQGIAGSHGAFVT